MLSSSLMSLSTPSIICWTSSTSEYPMRALFEMSNSPLGPGGECSPFDPRACTPSESQYFSSLCTPHDLKSLGNLSMTDARKPVPRLEGQVHTLPRCSLYLRRERRRCVKHPRFETVLLCVIRFYFRSECILSKSAVATVERASERGERAHSLNR